MICDLFRVIFNEFALCYPPACSPLLPGTGDEIVTNIMKLDHNYFFNQNKPSLCRRCGNPYCYATQLQTDFVISTFGQTHGVNYMEK